MAVDLFNESDELSRDYIAEIVDPPSFGGLSMGNVSEMDDYSDLTSDDFRDESMELSDVLQEGTIRLLQTRLNKEFILELAMGLDVNKKHKVKIAQLKIYGEHPPEGSAITGPARAALFDDEAADLHPLTAQERNAIDKLLMTIRSQAIRTRFGFERKEINTNLVRDH